MPFSLTDFDRNLVTAQTMKAVGKVPIDKYNFRGGEIPFQFPPKIKSDTKSANWIEKDVAEWEPIAIFKGSYARKISLELTYIATGHEADGVTWNTDSISRIVKDLRGILYSRLVAQDLPMWELKIYNHIPESGRISTWRTISVSERPGDTLITIDGITYAFRTDITLELAMVTKIRKKDKAHQNIANAPDFPKQLWY